MPGDLLANITAEIDARLAELRPLVAEYERLLSASGALGLDEPSPDRAPPRPAPRAAGRTTPTGARRRAAGPRGSAAGAIVRAGSSPRSASPSPRSASPSPRSASPSPRSASPSPRSASPRSAPPAEGGGREVAPRAARGAAQQAILAALEHGSHTVGELAVVTAMSGQNIRENLRRMLSAGAITRAKREGKAAYALAGAKAAGH